MYQSYFGEIKKAIAYFSSEQLKELLNDDEKLEKRITDLLTNLDTDKEKIIAENRRIAEENVNKEPEIFERKSRLSELAEQGKTLCATVQDQLNDIKSKRGDRTPETVLALLQAATAECEEYSERIAAKFQEKDMSIEEYIEGFMGARKQMHLRKLKTEKMLEIIRKENTPSFYSTHSSNLDFVSCTVPLPRQSFGHF